MKGVLVCACCAALVVGACGGSGTAIDPKGAELLGAEVRAAREAVANGDFTEASTMLQTVENTVNALREQDKISDTRAAEVLTAVGDVEDGLRAWVERNTTTIPPTTVAPVPATPTPSNDSGDGDDDNRGKGNQKDRRGNDNNDDD